MIAYIEREDLPMRMCSKSKISLSSFLCFFRLIADGIRMSITTESSPSTYKTTQVNIVEPIDDITKAVDGQTKPLVIILAVTLPTLACIGILIILIVCYRRRHTTIWLKKLGNLIIFSTNSSMIFFEN
jgi:hypothetical protein